MSIPSIPGTGRVSPVGADPPAPNAAERQSMAAPEVKPEPVLLQTTPPRFPWLSRLSQQLEQAANKKPAFPPAPMLGDNIDRTA
jgi:hypothetical protein